MFLYPILEKNRNVKCKYDLQSNDKYIEFSEQVTLAAVKSAPKMYLQSTTTGIWLHPCFIPALHTDCFIKSTAGKYKLFPGVINKYSIPLSAYNKYMFYENTELKYK